MQTTKRKKRSQVIVIHGRTVTKLCTSMPGIVCTSKDNELNHSRWLAFNFTKLNEEGVNNKQTPRCVRVGDRRHIGMEKSVKGYTPGCEQKLEVKRQGRRGKQAKKKRKPKYIKFLHIWSHLLYARMFKN